ncbi:uncharacterized protein N7446_000038 [Penicillium canescens]|uniref:IQ calmodulin-binding motif protein n=1 Tax=Penicillium canescens TaxID=5083 RepID=A0AAD6N5X0_PENCN|nr:uncharacterized protein N7446_000038 [Penicillium canescens]KAJ6030895.1 hypothetical protein N7460_011161 [Penicillium canescens]KAJ6059383.1 hypothetical protein N7444_003022 [Penicillium canescens]KAJ6077102.1 hypothetical protein N7446_000038 [Penicillium canescens]
MARTPSPEGRDVIERAARTVQRVYRGYRTRRELRGFGLSASARWAEAVREAQWHQLHRPANLQVAPADDGFNQARRNWQRAVSVARRAGGDDDRVSGSPSTGSKSTYIDVVSSGAEAKVMDLKYFLEIVDLKHRHGSNLRSYHNYWQNSPTNQNFFYWLDYGEGRNLELEQCPRERLEKQQVRYLTREQRLNYLVTVDEAGLFRWDKSNELVWTNSARFKDSLDGIVDIEDDAPQFIGNETTTESASICSSSSSSPSSSSTSSSTTSMDSALSDEETKPFTEEEYKAAKVMKKVLHASPTTAFKRMMGKSTEKENMWIFVADSSFRLYIGIKKSGAFQHSSFLRGARIAAAGMIKIKHGQLRSLAPLSGHYRPSAANFRAFHHALQQQGVDMSHVSMSKSYMMLAGIEGYTKAKRKLTT